MKNLLTVISLLITSVIFGQTNISQDEMKLFLNKGFSTFSIDSLNIHYEKKLNEYRNSIGVFDSKYNKELIKIAQDQSDYCLKNNVFTHFQDGSLDKKTPWDRGEYYNLPYPVFSENLFQWELSTSIRKFSYHNINFYDLLSVYILENWKTSPGHNKNLISRGNQMFALSISMKDNNIICCMLMVTNEIED